ncbi:MAG: family 10 glycosylhydrolase [Longimicrobiales bacterium]
MARVARPLARTAACLALGLAGCVPSGVTGPAAPPEREPPPPIVTSRPPVAPTTPAEPAQQAAARSLPPVRSFEEVRGLWVVRWSMTNEQQVREMVAAAADAGFNTLVVQVRGRGDAYYRSAIEPRAEGVQGPVEFDPLALTIEEGHRRGLAVHAWVNTHLVWGPAAPPLSPSHLVNAHPEWLAVPRQLARELRGVDPRSPRFVTALRQYAADRPQTVEGIYTSPSHPEVRARVREVWLDLVDRYDLDGIHFDYIRYPSADFDYSEGALERFREWIGPQLPPSRIAELDRMAASDPLVWTTALAAEWDEFRRSQITSLVAELYREVKARRPELVVSAAVVPDRTTAHTLRFQEWDEWLEDGILDVAVPMAYTASTDTFRGQMRAARVAAGRRDRVWAGIGAYMNSAAGTLDKIDIARAEDSGGVILFSYDWIVGEGQGSGDGLLTQLGRERFGS